MHPKSSDAFASPNPVTSAKKSNVEIEIYHVVTAETPNLLKDSAAEENCNWFSDGIRARSYDESYEIGRCYTTDPFLSTSWSQRHATRWVDDVSIGKTKGDVVIITVQDRQLAPESIRVQDVILSHHFDKISPTYTNCVVPVVSN